MDQYYGNHKVEITLYYDQIIDDSFYMGAHYHPRHEIMYCLEGEFQIELYENAKDSKYTTIHTFTPKTYIILQPNIIHRLVIPKGKTARMLNIEFYFFSSLPNEIQNNSFLVNFEMLFKQMPLIKDFFKNKNGYLNLNDDGSFGKKMRELITMAGSPFISKEKLILKNVLFFQLLLLFSECHSSSSYTNFGIKYLNAAVKFIRENYDKKITVEEIAQNAGVNKFYLQKLFNEHVNMSIINYLNYYRIELSKTLLTNDNISITDLYKKVGFANRQSFLYEFKKRTNTTPTNYRNTHIMQTIDMQVSDFDSRNTVEIPTTTNKQK